MNPCTVTSFKYQLTCDAMPGPQFNSMAKPCSKTCLLVPEPSFEPQRERQSNGLLP